MPLPHFFKLCALWGLIFSLGPTDVQATPSPKPEPSAEETVRDNKGIHSDLLEVEDALSQNEGSEPSSSERLLHDVPASAEHRDHAFRDPDRFLDLLDRALLDSDAVAAHHKPRVWWGRTTSALAYRKENSGPEPFPTALGATEMHGAFWDAAFLTTFRPSLQTFWDASRGRLVARGHPCSRGQGICPKARAELDGVLLQLRSTRWSLLLGDFGTGFGEGLTIDTSRRLRPNPIDTTLLAAAQTQSGRLSISTPFRGVLTSVLLSTLGSFQLKAYAFYFTDKA